MNLSPGQLDEIAAALLSRGRFEEYLDVTETLVRDHPGRSNVHLHRARALVLALIAAMTRCASLRRPTIWRTMTHET